MAIGIVSGYWVMIKYGQAHLMLFGHFISAGKEDQDMKTLTEYSIELCTLYDKALQTMEVFCEWELKCFCIFKRVSKNST